MAILATLGFFGSWIGITIFNGWILSILWKWFMVPALGLPILTTPQAIGIALVIGYLTHKHTPSDDSNKKGFAETYLEVLFTGIAFGLLCLFVGWIVQLFM